MTGGIRKKLLLTTTSVDIGCSSCRKPKNFLSKIFHPKPKTATFNSGDNHHLYRSPSDSIVGDGFGKIGGVSVAVEKDSSDPYVDFRHSMLQMIVENQIYSQEGLRELLGCFLHLNSPCNHGIIIRAFAEIWDGGFCGKAAAAPAKRRRAGRSRGF